MYSIPIVSSLFLRGIDTIRKNYDILETERRYGMEFRHELVLPSEDLPFRMFIFEGKDGNYKVSKHWHRSIELFYVMDGTISFSMNRQAIELHNQEFVIVNSNEVHAIDAPEKNRTIVVQIPLDAFEGLLEVNNFVTFAKQSEEQNQALAKLLVCMYETYEQKAYAYQLKVKSLFLELLYRLLHEFREDHQSIQEIKQKRQLDRLSQVTQYMRSHYQEELTLEGVAQRFGFTPTYLSRVFRAYANVNYHTYLMDLRVQFALQHMLNSQRSIGEIAMEHGFSDGRSFCKAFRKRYGCLPSVYRKKIHQ